MKLSDYIIKFENIDKAQEANSRNVLTQDQANIFRDIFKNYKKNRYAVLMARSGSGKTTLIRAIAKHCDANGISCVLTATTGKAASAIGGQTIHSYLGLKMTTNDNATNKDEALVLTSEVSADVEKPQILIIDEASMCGQRLFSSIESARFPFVFFVMDGEQLPPVKEKKVEWDIVCDLQYTLTQTLRAKEPRMTKLFDDFRSYKEGKLDHFDLYEHINGENIVLIDWDDVDYIPTNSECCSVAYRNKLVEFLVKRLTTKEHNMYNLNTGVTESRMIATEPIPEENGYYKREFADTQIFFNGEDVKIDKLTKETQQIVEKGYAYYNGYKISINKSGSGLTISAHNSCKVEYNAKEPREHKVFIKFPKDDVITNTTLACINDKHFVLLWDGTEDELNSLVDSYFMRLLPYLRTVQSIRKWYKHHDKNDIRHLDYDIQQELKTKTKREFDMWFATHRETADRKSRWSDFMNIKKIASARHTTSRTVHKSQGISIPACVIFDDSFYGASLSAQYVALTRAKHGIILVKNTPDEWKNSEDYIGEFE